MTASMYRGQANPLWELLAEVRHRVPPGSRMIREAFTTEHRRPVLVKVSDLTPDTFYEFDEITAQAFHDAVIDIGARDGGGRLTVCCPFPGELHAQQRRLQRVAGKVERIRVLMVGSARAMGGHDTATDFYDIAANPLARYSFAIKEGARPLLFICREDRRPRATGMRRSAGFFAVGRDVVEEVADDVELLLRGAATTLVTFDELELLHRTTQRISRELESYSRRMEWAVRRARRRPELLTRARFDRIVGQAIAKMGQLKEIPRQALRSIDRNGF
ncbi:MAG TPA: hypothetical protein VMV72_04700 [Verrucomicrobiae bacterium]|nr:hypothetical protein [Verrucomicrobiae bacterium]